jgi:serine/threonine-protein kinase
MALAPGQRFGPYEIQSTLGAGGMGEVYRARDSKLNRDVALKILPEALAADPDRLARFRREAQVLAALNHPNIAAIYGVEDFQGHQALVMELVPGRTLAEIIEADGALAPDAVVGIAGQVADALEAAHEAGIIHRDLKPANIKRRDDDVVKVLDFGLAKGQTASELPNTMSSPTMLSPAVTQHGVILGTAGYMSPEQAKGRSVDKRADIWAFGVVIYELLTGQRLFGGETVTETIAAVIKDAPRLDALPAGTPPPLRRLLARCLERDPKLRLRDIGEARIMLRSALDPSSADARVTASAAPRRRSPVRIAIAVAGAIALAGAAAVVAWNAKPNTPLPVRRLELPAAIVNARDAALSPDGARIAYLAEGRLYVRALDAAEPVDLGAVSPTAQTIFWSPDGRSLGYSAESTIRTIPSSGGPTFTVGKVPASARILAAAWREDNTILMAVWRDSLYRVSATGGTPTVHVAIDPATEIDFHSIALLPGNRLVVTTHLRSQQMGQENGRLDLVDGDRRTTLAPDMEPGAIRFIPPNQLLFLRTRTNPGAWVVPFTSGAVDITKAVLVEPAAADFDASSEGTMIVRIPVKVRRELVWVDHAGVITPVPGPAFEARSEVALSRDGRRAALVVRTSDLKDRVVVRELTTGADTRVPLPDPNGGLSPAPLAWTTSGRLLLTFGGIESSKIFDWPADGSSNGRPLTTGVFGHLSRDGRELLFLVDDRGVNRLRRAPVLADGSVGKIEPVFAGNNEPSIRWFDLSPDGHLLAYCPRQDDTQQLNLFVTTYPDMGERRQITSEGGTQPKFSHDGTELFYLSGTRTEGGVTRGQLHVVPVKSTSLTTGAPKTILTESSGGDRGPAISGFDVAPDGRLIMTRVVPSAAGDEARLILLQNWPASIRK